MPEKISGSHARDKYGLTVEELAEACRDGKLKAFSSFDERQIYSAESCTAKHFYPVKRFAVKNSPSFIVEDILFNKKTLDDFYIHFDNNFCDQDISIINRETVKINDDIFYLYKIKDLKEELNSKNDFIDTRNYAYRVIKSITTGYKWLKIQNFLELRENTDIKDKFYIDIIYRGYTHRIDNINDRFLHVKCWIEHNNELYDSYFKMENDSIEQVIDILGVESYEKIEINGYKQLYSLWNNTYKYFYNNVELKNEDYFIFNYEMYKLYRNIYREDEKKIKEDFQKKVLSFIFERDKIEEIVAEKKRSNILKDDPKEYLIRRYSELLDVLNREMSNRNSLNAIRVDMYIKKLQGKTNKELMDEYNAKNEKDIDETRVTRYIGEDIEKIAREYKIPYVDWKKIIKVKTSNTSIYTNEELTKDIESQLIEIQSFDNVDSRQPLQTGLS